VRRNTAAEILFVAMAATALAGTPDAELIPIARIDFEAADGTLPRGAVARPDGKGHAVRGVGGYAFHTTPRSGKGIGPTCLEVRLVAWGSGGAELGVRCHAFDAQGKRTKTGTGLWGREVAGTPTAITTRFHLPEGGAESVCLLFYRSNTKGTVWVDDVAIDAMRLHPAPRLVAEVDERLKGEGWRTRIDGEHLVAEKPRRRAYYRTFGNRQITRWEFDGSTYQGTTCISQSASPAFFPIGTYFYGSVAELSQIATARRLTFGAYIDQQMADMAAHGCNAVYLANLTIDPAAFRTAVAAARKHRLAVFAQLTRDLYPRPSRGPEHYDKVTVPTATRIMPGYRHLPGVAAWMPKEEAAPDQVPLLRQYRNLIRKLDPTHAIFTLHNSVATFREDNHDVPEWFGFDRYRFRSLFGKYGILISTPKDAAARLRSDLRSFQQEAALRDRPIVYVGQAGGWDWRGSLDDLLKITHGVVPGPNTGWHELKPGTWYGWMRYLPPKHGIRLQFWLAVLEGYKGMLFYHHKSRLVDGPHGAVQHRGMKTVNDESTPQWEETAQTVRELTPLVPLILAWHKEAIAPAHTDHAEVWVRSFIRNFKSERYLVLVNARIAEWDKDSPGMPRGATNLKFTPKGLEGLREAPPITCNVTVDSTLDMYALPACNKLEPIQATATARVYRVTVPPGGGRVFVLGDPAWARKGLRQTK